MKKKTMLAACLLNSNCHSVHRHLFDSNTVPLCRSPRFPFHASTFKLHLTVQSTDIIAGWGQYPQGDVGWKHWSRMSVSELPFPWMDGDCERLTSAEATSGLRAVLCSVSLSCHTSLKWTNTFSCNENGGGGVGCDYLMVNTLMRELCM